MQIVNFLSFMRRMAASGAKTGGRRAAGMLLRSSKSIWVAIFAVITTESALSESLPEPDCRIIGEGGTRYTVCSFDPSVATLRVYDMAPDGKPYGGFDRLGIQLWKERRSLRFATNGGMYHNDLSPVGLFTEYGIERKQISTRSGFGNFHLQPNGVFFVDGASAGVMETGTYRAAGIKPDFATQSGPMLVIAGKLHPKFLADSDSFKRRNGVGVDAAGRVHFAISEGTVRFYDFATFFRDRLGCANALYLDGTISSVYSAETGRNDRLFPLGPIIAVTDLVR